MQGPVSIFRRAGQPISASRQHITAPVSLFLTYCNPAECGCQDFSADRTFGPEQTKGHRTFRSEKSQLFALERLALDNLMDERPQTAAARFDTGEDLLDRVAIGELDAGPGGIDEQVARQVTGHLVLALHEQLLEFVDILEFPAIGQLARGIDGGAELVFPDDRGRET